MGAKSAFYAGLQQELKSIQEQGLFKRERIIASPQDAVITLTDGSEVLNFCANNYLGLSSHPKVLEAAHAALESHGFGMSSVRFICGTQDIHKTLEQKLAQFLHTEDTILYAAAFDANGGVFEPLLGEQDAIISDSLNHASIIDGVRLCKAMRFRYANNDMADLEAQLKAADAAGAKTKLIVTDGVFSMDGYVAQMDAICDLADQYDALVMVDECHATGFIGATGPRVDRIARCFGPCGHHYRHPGQSPRRRHGRLHDRQEGSDRNAPPTLAPLPLQQLVGPRHCGGVDRRFGPLVRNHRTPRQARSQCPAVQSRHARRRL